MLKQRPIVYLALVAVFGGLWLSGVPVDTLLFGGFVVFMLMMHLGGHGHGGHGQGGHEENGTQTEPVEQRHAVSAPKAEEVAEK